MSGRILEIPSSFGNLAAIEWGPSNGIPLLAVHGWHDNALSFQPLVEILPRLFHVIAIECPGHGYSSRLANGYPYSDILYAFCVREVADWLKWNKFSIIGHSLGAIIAIKFTALFPGRVENLITLDILYPNIIGHSSNRISLSDGVALFLTLNAKEFASTSRKSVSWEQAIEAYGKPRPKLSRKNIELLLQRSARPSKTKGMYEFTRDYRISMGDFFMYGRMTSEKIMEEMVNYCGNWLAIVNSNDVEMPSGKRDSRPLSKEHIANCKSFQVIQVDDDNHYFHMESPQVIAPYIVKVLCGNADSKL